MLELMASRMLDCSDAISEAMRLIRTAFCVCERMRTPRDGAETLAHRTDQADELNPQLKTRRGQGVHVISTPRA